jgi:hypothetical protein
MTLKVKEHVAPGIWIDTDGYPHISIPDLLDYFRWPHDEEHKRGIERVAREIVARMGKEVRRVDRCPNCGATGKDVHSAICALGGKGN